METLDLSPASNIWKNVNLLLLNDNIQNTYTVQDSDFSVLNQANDSGSPTFDNLPKKTSLADKLKSSSNKNVKEAALKPVKCPTPSTSSQPLSAQSLYSTSPSSIMKLPNAPDGKTRSTQNSKGNANKKSKVKSRTNSNDSFYSNIDQGFEPTQDLFNANPQISLSLNQFKNFFENVQGCTGFKSLCKNT